MTETTELLKSIITEKFDIDPAKLRPEATVEDIGIDSLDIFDIVFDIEEKLHIKVPNDDVRITTLQDLVDLIERIYQEQKKA